MTLPELLRTVCDVTSWPRSDVHLTVRRNWPNHQAFTPTQAALLVDMIAKKEARK